MGKWSPQRREHRHLEIYVNPYPTRNGDRTVLITVRDEFEGAIKGDLKGRNALEAFVAGCRLSQEVMISLARRLPGTVPGIIDTSLAGIAGERVNYTRRILSSDPPGIEGIGCENALPMQDGRYLDATEEIFRIAAAEASNRKSMSLLSLRFVRGTPFFLAPQYSPNREPWCLIELPTPSLYDPGRRELSTFNGAVELFRMVSTRMLDFGGRPHWGLEFNTLRGIGQVRKLYPALDKWLDAYRFFNPTGVFDNPFTDRMGFRHG